MADPIEAIEAVLRSLGCPSEQVPFMAIQLNKRAHQLAEQTGRDYASALQHLLTLTREARRARNESEPAVPTVPPSPDHAQDP